MTKPVDLTDDFTTDIFEYLDDLRQSGETNMLGAASYLERDWGLSSIDARGFLKAWMDTFSERHPNGYPLSWHPNG